LCFLTEIRGFLKLDLISDESFKKELYDFLGNSIIGLIKIDIKSTSITHINQSLKKSLGYSPNESIDQESLYNSLMGQLYNSNQLVLEIKCKNKTLKKYKCKIQRRFDDSDRLITIKLWLQEYDEYNIYQRLINELNTNFLDFSNDFRNNIALLLKTFQELVNAKITGYVHQTLEDSNLFYEIFYNNKRYFKYSTDEFQSCILASDFMAQNHSLPQNLFNIQESEYYKTDPMVKRYGIESSYGRVLKKGQRKIGAIFAFFDGPPKIKFEYQFILYMISNIIENEEEKWQMRKNLEAQNRMLLGLERFRTKLLMRTSHELKTPLIAIKGYTDLILNDSRSEVSNKIIRIIEHIKKGCTRLESLVDDLIMSSKYNDNQIKLTIKKVNLSEIINNCINTQVGRAVIRHQSLKLDLDDTIEINVDEDQITTAICHLISNAIKYTPKSREIHVKTKKIRDKCLFSIKDNGIGISLEENKHLFKLFGKIEHYGRGFDVDTEGPGLGLFLTKNIIELHGGEIWVESGGRNMGSTFYFTLPYGYCKNGNV